MTLSSPLLVLNENLPALSFHATYAHNESDDGGRAEVPIGGDPAYVAFNGISPTLGTGIFGGQIGIDSIYNYDWERDYYEVGFSWLCSRRLFGDATVLPQFAVFWGEGDIEFQASDTFLAFPNLYVMTDRRINNDFWGARLGAEIEKPIGGNFSLGFEGGLIYQSNDAEATSRAEINLLGVPESLEVRNSERENDWGGYIGAGVNYDINQHFRLSIKHRLSSGVGNVSGTSGIDGDATLAGEEIRPAFRDGGQDTFLNLVFSF